MSTAKNNSQRAANQPPKLAYIMSRFPKISETFILYEILEMEKLGASVEVYPLLRERQPVVHPEAEKMCARAHFLPFLSWFIVRANLHFTLTRPLRYFTALLEALFGTIRHPNFFFGALAYWPKAVAFAFKMKQQGVEHVHAHFCNHPALAAFIVHRLTGIPYSFIAHGSDLHKNRTMLGKKVAASSFALTVSKFNLAVLQSACDESTRKKTLILHCGIDPEVFLPKKKTANGGALRIVCVASFEEVKGHRHLVEACRILREREVEFVCDLIGDGPQRAAITEQIKAAHLEKRVILHGSMTRGDVVRMLAAADVKVLASVPTAEGKREGVPVVLMEAMACGLPVISSRLSGIPELVDNMHTGILVPPGDAAVLARALEQLQHDPALRERMGKAGREKVLREYNLKENTKKLLEMIIAAKEERAASFAMERKSSPRKAAAMTS
jgi:glycosyltransferase involved in cell wall biosynthesis